MAVGFVAPRRASVPNASTTGWRQQALRKCSATGASNRRRSATHSAAAARRECMIFEGSVLEFPPSFEHGRSRVSRFSSGSMSRRGSVSSKGSVESTSDSTLSVASYARRPSWLLPQTPDEYSDWSFAKAGDASFDTLVSTLLASQSFVASARVERRCSESDLQQAHEEFLNSIPATPEARYCQENIACISFFHGIPTFAGQMDDLATTATQASDLSSLGELTTPDGISTPSEADDVSDCSSTSSKAPRSFPLVRQASRTCAFPFVPFASGQQRQVVSEPSRSASVGSAQVWPAPEQNMGATLPGVTTVMLRNLPQKYTREMLMDDMDGRGFKDTYDFLYLPVDFKSKLCAGYAFINFISEADYARFKHIYHSLKLGNSKSPKVCEVQAAKKQGKDCNTAFYRNNAVMGWDEKYHPLVFKHGVRKPFPKPTQAVEGRTRKSRNAA